MKPNVAELLGIFLLVASAAALVMSASMVAAELAWLTAGLLGLPAGLTLIRLANRAALATPKAGDQP